MAQMSEETEKALLEERPHAFGESVPCFYIQASYSGSPSVESVLSVVQLYLG